MPDWDSNLYLKFEQQRTQPAHDLALRIHSAAHNTIADIGCGPGNSTAVLKQVFPDADIVGIDSSPDMIAKASAEHPALRFCLGDASELEGKYDILFSNACLQWIPDHESLIPSLMKKLNTGGVLAVQIPMNSEEPLFKLIEETTKNPKWGFPASAFEANKTLTPSEYFDILSGCSSSFDIWETKYYHELADHTALVEWVKGTRLRPYLELLNSKQSGAFLHEITDGAKKLYPVMQNGAVLLGFRRFFFTAVN